MVFTKTSSAVKCASILFPIALFLLLQAHSMHAANHAFASYEPHGDKSVARVTEIESSTRSYDLHERGILMLNVPVEWRDDFERPPLGQPQMPTITFISSHEKNFEIKVSVLWLPDQVDEKMTDSELLELLGKFTLELKDTFIEESIHRERLEGDNVHGYYYRATRRDSQLSPNDYKYLTFGNLALDELCILFSVQTKEKENTVVEQAMTLLKNARRIRENYLIGLPLKSTEFALQYPHEDWVCVLDLPGFSMGPIHKNLLGMYVFGNNKKSGILCSLSIVLDPSYDNALEYRDFSWILKQDYFKKFHQQPTDIKMFEQNNAALTEYTVEASPESFLEMLKEEIPTLQEDIRLPEEFMKDTISIRHRWMYMVHDDFCMSVHISKGDYKNEHKAIFDEIISSMKIIPASVKPSIDLSNESNRILSMEKPFLHTLQLIKDRKYDVALKVLWKLCKMEKTSVQEAERLYDKDRGDMIILQRATLLILLFELEGVIKTGSAINDESSELYRNLAEREGEHRAFDLTETLLRISIDRDPNNLAAWFNLGQVYRRYGKYEESNNAFDVAWRINPHNASYLYWLAMNKIDQRKFEEAEDLLVKTLEVNSQYHQVWYLRGDIQMKQAKYKAALENFKKAKSLGVDSKDCNQKIKECKNLLKKSK